MPTALQVPNPAMSPDQLGMINMSNNKDIQNALNKKGCQLLVNYITQNTQAITSTSFVAVNGFQQSITSSGGIITIQANFVMFTNGLQNAVFQLLVDSKVVTSTACGSWIAAGGSNSCALNWMGILPSGQHTISIQAKVSGGTSTINSVAGSNPSYSSLFVREDGTT